MLRFIQNYGMDQRKVDERHHAPHLVLYRRLELIKLVAVELRIQTAQLVIQRAMEVASLPVPHQQHSFRQDQRNVNQKMNRLRQ